MQRDGVINQFKNAMPVIDTLGLPRTFFIVTREIPGSKYKPKFIGRLLKEFSMRRRPSLRIRRIFLNALLSYKSIEEIEPRRKTLRVSYSTSPVRVRVASAGSVFVLTVTVLTC